MAETQMQFYRSKKEHNAQHLTALQHQIKELQARDDDSAIIGQLQHKYLELKMLHKTQEQRFQDAKLNSRKLQIALSQMENALLDKGKRRACCFVTSVCA